MSHGSTAGLGVLDNSSNRAALPLLPFPQPR
jgi:hypothetical protein